MKVDTGNRGGLNELSALTTLLAALLVVGACSAPQTDTAVDVQPPTTGTQVIDTGPYALENSALDRAAERMGLPREASLWVRRSASGNVVCGALARPAGKPVLYFAGMLSGGFVGVPLARLTPEVGEEVLDVSNRAVLKNCRDNGLVPPERVLRLLAD